MPGPFATLVTKVAALGTAAKAAVGCTVVVAIVGAAGGAAAVLGSPGGASDAATVAHATGQVQAPPEPSPTTVTTPPTTAAPTTAAPTTPTTKAQVAPARTPRAAAPTTTVAAASPSVATQTASAPAPLPTSGVARRTPSSTEVQQALKVFPQYVKTFLKPTPAQVAQLGDRVCTAFDEGQTFAQVKATGLEMVTQLPRTSSPAGPTGL